jgi:hypothetical protein
VRHFIIVLFGGFFERKSWLCNLFCFYLSSLQGITTAVLYFFQGCVVAFDLYRSSCIFRFLYFVLICHVTVYFNLVGSTIFLINLPVLYMQVVRIFRCLCLLISIFHYCTSIKTNLDIIYTCNLTLCSLCGRRFVCAEAVRGVSYAHKEAKLCRYGWQVEAHAFQHGRADKRKAGGIHLTKSIYIVVINIINPISLVHLFSRQGRCHGFEGGGQFFWPPPFYLGDIKTKVTHFIVDFA